MNKNIQVIILMLSFNMKGDSMPISIKELITYIAAFAGIAIVCIVRVRFSKRQLKTPDNAYTPDEKKLLYTGYAILAIALILACIPVY